MIAVVVLIGSYISSHALFKGKGRIYCTTQRIIFVAEKGITQNGCYFEAFVGFAFIFHYLFESCIPTCLLLFVLGNSAGEDDG